MYIGKPRTAILPSCARCAYIGTPEDEQPCSKCYGLFLPSEPRGCNSPGVADLVPERERTPAEVALNSITAVLDEAKRGQWKPADALQWIRKIVDDYFEENPIPYELTEKAGADDD